MSRTVVCDEALSIFSLQMDVDIGSSSVARNIVGLVIGYVTGLVVDLAVVIQVSSPSVNAFVPYCGNAHRDVQASEARCEAVQKARNH